MAGQYRRKQNPRHQGRLLGHLLFGVVFFIVGYLSASLYDLTHISSWIGAHVLANHDSQMMIKPHAQATALPKPKFEFYTLLANERVAGSHPAVAAVKAPVTVAVQSASSQPSVPATQSVNLPLHAPLSPVAPPVVATVEKKPVSMTAAYESYLIQVGSFRSAHEAERMKASLVMKGFNVAVSTATQNSINWYRVIIGPFSSREQAQTAQQAFARSEHIVGMVRKMDA
jgi:cell division protein FtsN